MKDSIVKCKEWWATLAYREKRTITIGGSLLAIFLIYACIWSPFIGLIGDMRSRIETQQKTLVWMQTADADIRKLSEQSKATHKILSPVMLLSYLQKRINQEGLEQYLTQLKQSTNEAVEMHFQKVEFDKLVTLLMTVMKEQSVSIAQMSVAADVTPGLVNADVVINLG